MSLPNSEFKVLLFGPDLPAGGLGGFARFEAGVLVAHAEQHWYTVGADQLDLVTGGFDGKQWLVHWRSARGEYSAMLRGESAMHHFVEQAPEGLAQRLHLARRRHRALDTRFRLALVLFAALLALPLFGLLWFWFKADDFSRWAAEQVSVEQEIRLGDIAFERLRPGVKLLAENTPADELVDRIGVRLTVDSRYPFQFHVADDPAVNAYALPGGHIVVNTGLLKAVISVDELIGVMAHEISHVELRHSLRSMIHALGLRAVLAAATGDVTAGVWGDVAGKLAGLAYSRDLEREADLHALKLLRHAALPPDGLPRFLAQLAENEQGGADFLSTHPNSQERIQALEQAIAAQGAYSYQLINLDWADLKAGL